MTTMNRVADVRLRRRVAGAGESAQAARRPRYRSSIDNHHQSEPEGALFLFHPRASFAFNRARPRPT